MGVTFSAPWTNISDMVLKRVRICFPANHDLAKILSGADLELKNFDDLHFGDSRFPDSHSLKDVAQNL